MTIEWHGASALARMHGASVLALLMCMLIFPWNEFNVVFKKIIKTNLHDIMYHFVI